MAISISSSPSVANNLRIASLSIALYDYLYTLPAEWRFYKGQAKSASFRLSLGFVLFVLIRYLSVVVLVVSNVGFFSHHFTPETCRHYYMAAPILKVLQAMICQAILGVRTYNISRRNRYVGWVVLIAYFCAIVIEWFSNLYNRLPVEEDGNCSPGTRDPDANVSVWVFYLTAMLYDLLTLTVSTVYLVKCRSSSFHMSHLMKVMLYDGIGYFVALTAANVLNLILYRASNTTVQSAGASLGYAVSWIMSQRILIHLRDAGAEPPRTVIAHHLQSSRDINDALRNAGAKASRIERENVQGPPGELDGVEENELDVQVRVERSVVVDYKDYARGSSEREIYSAPKVMWDQGLPSKR